MFLSFLCLLFILPQFALSAFDFVAYSRIQQCGPFNVSFHGGQPPAALPLTLTVIPFNSTPLAFTIPESAWDDSSSFGSYVTFLPLPAGVGLMASLDDAVGNNAALISDVIHVLPSTNASCISTDQATPLPFRLVDDTVSQCLPFNVSRNASSLDHPLSARGFIPASFAFRLQSTVFFTSQDVDTFTYIMNVAYGLRIALLFDDGQGNRQVSDLLSVGGGATSPSGCLQGNSVSSATTAQTSVRGVSRSAVIAISVTSSIAILIIVILGVILIRRERLRLIRLLTEDLQNRQINAPSPPAPPELAQTPAGRPSSPVPVDPVYPAELFMIPSTESRTPQSTRSTIFAPFVPSSLRSAKSQSSLSRSVSTRTRNSVIKGAHARSFVDLDIAGLLEAASQQPAATEPPRGYPDTTPRTVTPVPTLSVPPSPLALAHSARNFLHPRERGHQEPDVPLSPLSRVSQEWPSPEHPVAAMAVPAPQNGLSSRSRPLPNPPRGTGILRLGKKPVRF